MLRKNYKVEVVDNTKKVVKYLNVSAYSKKEARELAKTIHGFHPNYCRHLGRAIEDME